VLEVVWATRILKYRDIIYLITCITVCSDYVTSTLLAAVLICHELGPKEGAGVFYIYSQTHITCRKHYTLHIEVLVLKLKIACHACFLSCFLQCKAYYCVLYPFNMHQKYNLHGFRSGE
jgi:hypothetical protein